MTSLLPRVTDSGHRVVVTDFDYPDLAIERSVLEPAGLAVDAYHVKSESKLEDIVRDAEGVIVQYARISRAVVAAMPHCRIVVRYGVGLDTIDQEATRERGIEVRNVPDYCIEEVADHTLALMLSILRGVHVLANEVAAGHWGLSAARPLRRIRGLTLGLVGCGRIGAALASRAAVLGMQVIGYDAFLDDAEVRRRGIEPVSFERVLAEADVLSLHLPGNPDGTPALGPAEFERVKPGLVVLNAARGSLIDEDALRAALSDGRVRAAGLDVLLTEPPPSPSLASLPGVIVTPHAGWYSEQSEIQLRTTVATIVRDALLAPVRK